MADETFLGTWFDPSNKNIVYSGVLSIKDDQSVEIEMMVFPSQQPPTHWDLLHGFTVNGDYSLLSVSSISHPVSIGSQNIRSERYVVACTLHGHHLSSPIERFEHLSFSIDGLQYWSQLTGITQSMSRIGEEAEVAHEIMRRPPDPVTLSANGLTFTFVSLPGFPNEKWSVSLAEDTQVHVTATEPMTIAEWQERVVVPVQRLVQFCVRSGGTITRTFVSHDAFDVAARRGGRSQYRFAFSWGKAYSLAIWQLYFEQPLYNLSDFDSNQDALSAWFDLYRDYKDAINALLESQDDTTSREYRYFVHARLLERLIERHKSSLLIDDPIQQQITEFARRIVDEAVWAEYSGNLKTAARSKARAPLLSSLREWSAFVEPLKSNHDMMDWVAGKMINTRHCFAHHSFDSCRKAIGLGEIGYLQALVRTLIDYEVGRRLEFSPDLTTGRLENSRQIREGKVVKDVWKDDVDGKYKPIRW